MHAGILSTMADHTAGTAASTLIGLHQSVLTVEFKVLSAASIPYARDLTYVC